MKISCIKGGIGALALACGFAGAGQAQQTVRPAQKQAYIDQAKAHNQREAANDAAFDAHRKRLEADIAAAKRSGNQAQLKKLEAMQARDNEHLARDRTEDTRSQEHIKRTYGMKTK